MFYVAEGVKGTAYTRNLSEGGLFIETGVCLERGTPLDIEIYLDLGLDIFQMQAKAEIAWCKPADEQTASGMGIRFVSMNAEAQRALQRALARLEPDNG